MTVGKVHGPLDDAPLDEVLKALRAHAARDFSDAEPIPGAVNHAQAFLAHERERVFMREWICIGRGDELPEPGDYLTHEIAGVPVVAVRQDDGAIRAFVNACAHRFACLLQDVRGSAKRFVCRYHAWTYGLDGRLLRAPYMDMKPVFDATAHGLKPLHADEWQGFLYVSLADDPPEPLADTLEPLTRNVVGRYGMDCYRTVLRETMSWPANWKNLIENFTESYHVPMAHKKTFAKHAKPLADYVCGEDSDHYCYHRAAQSAETGSGAAHPGNDRLEGQWRRMMVDFCVFPCHLVTLMPDYLWYISVQPAGTGRFEATWGVAVPPEILEDIPADSYDQWLADVKAYMEVANGEDQILVEALHAGSASPVLPPGTLHPIEKNLWQFTRYLARMCCDSV